MNNNNISSIIYNIINIYNNEGIFSQENEIYNMVKHIIHDLKKYPNYVDIFYIIKNACKYGHYDIIQLLLDHNIIDLNYQDIYGNTALHYVRYCIKIARLLIANNNTKHLCNKDDKLPLMNIIDYININNIDDFVDIIINHVSPDELNNVNSKGVNILMYICEKPYFSQCINIILALLIKNFNMDNTDKSGKNALMYAVDNNFCNYSLIERLLTMGASTDINIPDNDGNTVLNMACKRSYQNIVELLISNGADINIANKKGITPLITATIYGHYNIANVLIINGCNVNITDNYGNSPLHVSSIMSYFESNLEISKLLINNGAQVNALNHSNKTPLIYASSSMSSNIYDWTCDSRDSKKRKIINVIKLINIFANHKADIDWADSYGNTALMNSIIYPRMHNKYIVRLLLSFGANPNIKNNTGSNSLILSVNYFSHNTPGIVPLFIESNYKNIPVDINDQDVLGYTALIHLCCKYEPNKLSTIKYLVDKGADLDKSGYLLGRDALFFAQASNNAELCNYLKYEHHKRSIN